MRAIMAKAGDSTGHAIKLIASDVDGTLLNHKQELTETVERAVQLARSVGVQVSPIASPSRKQCVQKACLCDDMHDA